MLLQNNTLRISGLDGLRGIAVTAVVFHHLRIFAPKDSAIGAIGGGMIGVDLFFVISGFLLTWLALEEFKATGRIHVRNFYMRRILRLIPALLLFLGVQTLYALVKGQLPDYLTSILATLFYYLNWKAYFTLDVAPGFGHLWSLSVEEQFYMLWPLCLILLLRSARPLHIFAILLLIAALVFFYRNYLWLKTGNWLRIYLRTDLRLDALALGASCAFLWRAALPARIFGNRIAGSLLFLVFLVLIYYLNPLEPAYYEWGASLVALLACGLIFNCCSSNGNSGGIFNISWLEYLGRRSYGLYLWHLPIFMWCSHMFSAVSIWLALTLALVFTAMVTEFSWWVVERPFNQLRNRYSHRAAGF